MDDLNRIDNNHVCTLGYRVPRIRYVISILDIEYTNMAFVFSFLKALLVRSI